MSLYFNAQQAASLAHVLACFTFGPGHLTEDDLGNGPMTAEIVDAVDGWIKVELDGGERGRRIEEDCDRWGYEFWIAETGGLYEFDPDDVSWPVAVIASDKEYQPGRFVAARFDRVVG